MFVDTYKIFIDQLQMVRASLQTIHHIHPREMGCDATNKDLLRVPLQRKSPKSSSYPGEIAHAFIVLIAKENREREREAKRVSDENPV